MTDKELNDLYWATAARYDPAANHIAVIIAYARAVLAHEQEAQPANAGPTKVLMEHSGCGSNTQVDQLTVRLNPGDKVVMVMGKITAAIDSQRLGREGEAQPTCPACDLPDGGLPCCEDCPQHDKRAAQPAAQEPRDA